jgi:energy-converting hydrogenase Eha subunit H
MNKDERGAIIASVVYLAVLYAIVKMFQDKAPVLAFTGAIIWTLLVILIGVTQDKIEKERKALHDKVKAVCKAEMRFIEERKAFYEKVSGK